MDLEHDQHKNLNQEPQNLRNSKEQVKALFDTITRYNIRNEPNDWKDNRYFLIKIK
jgi:hypothetical protein